MCVTDGCRFHRLSCRGQIDTPCPAHVRRRCIVVILSPLKLLLFRIFCMHSSFSSKQHSILPYCLVISSSSACKTSTLIACLSLSLSLSLATGIPLWAACGARAVCQPKEGGVCGGCVCECVCARVCVCMCMCVCSAV